MIRGGYGWFFDRFQSTNVLQAIRQNGINQQQYVVKNPPPGEAIPPGSLAASEAAPTTYSIAPNLRAPVNMQAAIGIEHRFGKNVTIASTYINSRGLHQLYSDNINAFLPGTYDITTGTGVRPNGNNENLYQFQSGGIYHQNQLITNFSIRERKVTLFGFYVLNSAKADTSGATYFPSNQFDPRADYGRSTFDIHHRFLVGGNYSAPFGISISPFLVLDSGTPFNITVGQDLNGDNQFNDRPAFATSGSTDVMQTKYGNFDLNPSGDAARIPYNYVTGPGQFSTNLRVSKSIGIGPRTEGAAGGGFNGPPPGGGGGRGPEAVALPEVDLAQAVSAAAGTAAHARPASIEALFAKLHGDGQKYLQQCEPGGACRGSGVASVWQVECPGGWVLFIPLVQSEYRPASVFQLLRCTIAHFTCEAKRLWSATNIRWSSPFGSGVGCRYPRVLRPGQSHPDLSK